MELWKRYRWAVAAPALSNSLKSPTHMQYAEHLKFLLKHYLEHLASNSSFSNCLNGVSPIFHETASFEASLNLFLSFIMNFNFVHLNTSSNPPKSFYSWYLATDFQWH